MKANLDACWRTRTEVQGSQRLENESSGVLAAGHTMFAAAFLATCERVDELQRRVAEAEVQREAVTAAFHDAESALVRVAQEFASAETRRVDGESAFQRVKDCGSRVFRLRLRQQRA